MALQLLNDKYAYEEQPDKLHCYDCHRSLTQDETSIIFSDEQVKKSKFLQLHSDISQMMLPSLSNHMVNQIRIAAIESNLSCPLKLVLQAPSGHFII